MDTKQRRMVKLTDGLSSKSAKMRALDGAGYSRREIANFLGTSYQFVRNVLVRNDERRGKTRTGSSSGTSFSENSDTKPMKVRLGPDGRIVVPAGYRNALALKEGDVLFARLEFGEIHLLTPTAAMRRAQAIVREFVPEGVSLVDELIEDRREEAAREAERG